MFEAGLADPRDGAYREVQLRSSNEDGTPLQTHAWVFAAGYAVCWNGLVYAVQNVGALADLDRDVHKIVSAQPWSRRQPFRSEPPAPAAFWFNMVSGQTMAPASIAMLLRLGRPDLAALFSDAPDARFFARRGEHETNLAEWFSAAVMTWLGSAFWRLTEARTHNDDQDAADVGESLLAWETSALALSQKMSSTSLDLSFLDAVPALLSDSGRRLREPRRPNVDFAGLAWGNGTRTPSSAAFLARPQHERITDLIDRLEDVHGDKIAIPGPIVFLFDPICELLTKEGEAAVGPLIDAYEHDQRLTRTLDYVRPWSTERTPIPVNQVVKIILGDILRAPDLVASSTPAELRAWWEQHKASSTVTRSFEVLADDHETEQRWLESAEFITRRSDIQLSGGQILAADEDCSPTKTAPEPYGEKLRSRNNPSVSALLEKRTAILTTKHVDTACRMAFLAFLWDPKASLPVLQTASNLAACRTDRQVTAARVSLGDPQAAADWAATIQARVSKPGFRTSELSPLWMFPDDPILQKAAEELFAQPGSPLSPAVEYQEINSPLLTIPAFRRALTRALSDESVVGNATRSTEGFLSFTVKNGGGGSSKPRQDPRQVAPGEERPVRVKDLAAWELSELDGAPEFNLDWPESDKDTAIAEIAEFLKRHQDGLQAFPAKPQDMTCPGEHVYLNQ